MNDFRTLGIAKNRSVGNPVLNMNFNYHLYEFKKSTCVASKRVARTAVKGIGSIGICLGLRSFTGLAACTYIL